MSGNPPSGEVYLAATDAAARLEVSASGLRRLADIYAEVWGPLERDPRTNGRLWTLTAVERLGAARALLKAGQAGSIRDALLALQRGVEPPTEGLATAPSATATRAMLEGLQRRLEALERDNRALKEQLDELLALNRQLARQLGRGTEAPARRPWWKWWGR